MFARFLPPLAAVLLLSSCALGGRDGGPSHSADLSHVPDPVPRAEPRSRYGNPDSYVVNGRRYTVRSSAAGYVERGIASWYGTKFHGRRTASGEIYDMHALTAAHTTLPLPTYVRVTNLNNGRSTVVRVNDRGPFHDNRLIDLSYAAASKLGIVETGTGLVEIRALTPGEPAPPPVTVAQSAPAAVSSGANLGSAAATTAPVGLYLQVGAFVSRTNAEQLRSRLSSEPLPPIQVQQGADASNTLIYRVRIGPIASVDEADRLASRLAALGIGTPHVVIE
ncbi:septal ring lytic transglycosylase RlpA family protein [Sulfurivermis fontis]|uniref:septal ring lytic transglycosylase RlpA family protein n=1 Tax=Sulfurivermis fontis TaxID=1972068 RepID=UPI000FDC7453|nr:septal ring lytic transglycosylase RlpA family protein [Sulfurivermis fontis]